MERTLAAHRQLARLTRHFLFRRVALSGFTVILASLMTRLRLPQTLTFPEPAAWPSHLNYDATRAAYEAADITEGYRFNWPGSGAPFAFSAIINLHHEKLWDTFLHFTETLPTPSAIIVNVLEDEPHFGPYLDRELCLDLVRRYPKEITTDPFLELGLIHQTPDKTEEVFITGSKKLLVWGMDIEGFKKRMTELGLEEKPGMRTIDEFPLQRIALGQSDPDALPYWHVMADLVSEFEKHRTAE